MRTLAANMLARAGRLLQTARLNGVNMDNATLDKLYEIRSLLLGMVPEYGTDERKSLDMLDGLIEELEKERS